MARILVVDDDDIARMVIGGILESGGYEVSYAAEGDAALLAYRESPFAAVVLDMVMPVRSGLEILRDLLEIDSDARVIIVSGARDRELQLAGEYGATATLQKPIRQEELLGAVQSAVADVRGV